MIERIVYPHLGIIDEVEVEEEEEKENKDEREDQN